MISSRALMGAIVVALLWTTQAAVAQDRTQTLLQALVSSEDDQAVAAARQELVRILRAPTPPDAQTLNAVVAAIPKGLDPSQRELVRINCALVAGAVNDPRAVSLLKLAMKDPHEAVRLPAARGLSSLANRVREQSLHENPAWSKAVDELLETLLASQKEETYGRVLEETFQGVSQLLDVKPDVVAPALLEALAERPTERLRHPNARVQAEVEALQRVYRRMVSPNVKSDPAQLRRLLDVAFRSMEASVVILEAHEKGRITLSPQRQREHREMIRLGDFASRWAAEQLNPSATELVSLAPIPENNLPEARLRVIALRATFRAAPFNMNFPELKMPAGEQAASDR